MLALFSVWMGLAAFVLALVMLVHRPTMTDLTIPLVLWFSAPASMALGGIVLWAYRKEQQADSGIAAQRMQARVGIVLALLGAGIVYGLIIASAKFDPARGEEPPVAAQTRS